MTLKTTKSQSIAKWANVPKINQFQKLAHLPSISACPPPWDLHCPSAGQARPRHKDLTDRHRVQTWRIQYLYRRSKVFYVSNREIPVRNGSILL